MRNNYIKDGKCIFCGKTIDDGATFIHKAHTMPQKMGSDSIGFDVCDECNDYFGKPDKSLSPHLSPEVCVKEIFGLSRFLFNMDKPEHQSDTLRSIYFNVWRSRNIIQFRKTFASQASFDRVFTRQFKRGLYEMFLQEYHKATGNGNENRFDKIRAFARYGTGDIPLWHYQNRGGVFFLPNDLSKPSFIFSDDSFTMIDTYGFYDFYLWGFWFILEVTDKANLCRDSYLPQKAKEMIGSGFVFKSLVEVKSIFDIDFTLRKLLGTEDEKNNGL